MSALFAFLHHICAFTLVAALVAEFLLLREGLTLENARIVQRADLAYGIAAGVIIVVGALRVIYFEKGPAYYMHSLPFIAKMTLFAVVGALSIYPTLQFLTWRKDTRAGRAPVIAAHSLRLMRLLIHIELAGIALIILCAALMARGIGEMT